MFRNFFFHENSRLWDNVEKYDAASEATHGNTILRKRFACWIIKATYTHSQYVIIFFHGNTRHENAPRCYFIRTLPVLFGIKLQPRSCHCHSSPTQARTASSVLRFLDNARHTVSRTPLVEGSARRRDLYLTTHTYPCPRRYTNLQSQQANRLSTSPLTVQPLLCTRITHKRVGSRAEQSAFRRGVRDLNSNHNVTGISIRDDTSWFTRRMTAESWHLELRHHLTQT
jgi:hypothetical protein